MKKNRGITLVSLIIYIILAIIVLSMLSVLSTHFKDNIGDLDVSTVHDTEFDKLNLQLLKETKTENNYIDEEQTTSTKLVFTNGNTYTYESNALYLNDNIKIAENLETFSSEIANENNKQKMTVTVTIDGITRTTEYVVISEVIIIEEENNGI